MWVDGKRRARERAIRFCFVWDFLSGEKIYKKYFLHLHEPPTHTQTNVQFSLYVSLRRNFPLWHFLYTLQLELVAGTEGKEIHFTHIRDRALHVMRKANKFLCKNCARFKHNVFEILDVITGRKFDIFTRHRRWLL